jgi:ribose transport system permease protein
MSALEPRMTDADPPARALRRRASRTAFLTRYGVLAAMVATFGIFSVLSPDAFFTVVTMKAILRDVTPLLILSLGVTVVCVMADFDLSVGGLASLLGTVAVLLLSSAHVGLNYVLAMLLAILIGAAIGLFNGVMIAYAGAPSFIFTLAMGTFFTGVQLQMTNSNTIYEGIPSGYTTVASGSTLGFSNQVYVGLLVLLVITVFLGRTEIGRFMYAIGGNPEAARLSGIRIRALKASGYAIVGVCAAIAAILLTAQAGAANPNLGTGLLLPAYAAAFLGSSMFRPGVFTPIGTLLGAIFLEIVGTGLSILNQSGPVVLIAQGGILAGAVLTARLSRR